MGWKSKIYKKLNRRGTRFLLAVAASGYACLRSRSYCRVYYDGAWVHKYPQGIIVEPEIRVYTLMDTLGLIVQPCLYEYTPKAGDIIVDVGAGTGELTVFFSRGVGDSGRVISIEAHPRMFYCLQETCRRNHLKNVDLLNFAITDSEATVLISDRAANRTNDIFNGSSGIPIQGYSLDRVVEDLHLPRVDFLKMNIEGAERMAIDGMSETIKKTREVCISCHDFLAAAEGREEMRTKSAVVAFLERNGFDMTNHELDPQPWVKDTVYGSNKNPLAPVLK